MQVVEVKKFRKTSMSPKNNNRMKTITADKIFSRT